MMQVSCALTAMQAARAIIENILLRINVYRLGLFRFVYYPLQFLHHLFAAKLKCHDIAFGVDEGGEGYALDVEELDDIAVPAFEGGYVYPVLVYTYGLILLNSSIRFIVYYVFLLQM